MFEIKVTVDPTFTAAVKALADAFSVEFVPPVSNTAPMAAVPNVPVAPIPTAPVAPVQTVPTAVPVAPPAPTAAPAPAPGVPTSVPTYTQEQISRAGTALIDMGKMNDLMALLARYGVAAITQLKPETYGAVAAELRALGAQI